MMATTLPFSLGHERGYAELPVRQASIDDLVPIGRWRSPHLQLFEYFEFDGATWRSQAGYPQTVEAWRRGLSTDDRRRIDLDSLSPEERDEILRATEHRSSSQLVVHDTIFSRCTGPAFVTKWNGVQGKPMFVLHDFEFASMFMPTSLRLVSLAADAMTPESVERILAHLPNAVLDTRDLQAHGRRTSGDEVAPIGAELALWSFLFQTRYVPLGRIGAVKAVAETRRFLQGRSSIGELEWLSHVRQDMVEGRIRHRPPDGDEALLKVVGMAAEEATRHEVPGAALLRIARERLDAHLSPTAQPAGEAALESLRL